MYPGRTCLVLVLLSTLFPVLHEGMLLCSSTCFQSERSALLHAQSNRIKWPWTNSSKAGHQHKLWPVKQFLWYASQQGKTKWSITDAHAQSSELKRPLTVMVSFHNSKSLKITGKQAPQLQSPRVPARPYSIYAAFMAACSCLPCCSLKPPPHKKTYRYSDLPQQ